MAKEITVDQSRKLEQLSNEFGHLLVQRQELAAYHLARFTTHRFPTHSHPNVIIVVGSGNNGAGGLVTAKHLVNAGHNVMIYLKDAKKSEENHGELLNILRKMPIEFLDLLDTKKADVIIDSLIGIGLNGELYEDTITTIKHLNESGKPLISFDVPSGMNPDTGEIAKVAVRPDHTVCIAAIKTGVNENANAGVVHFYDIGIPKQLYSEVGLEYPF